MIFFFGFLAIILALILLFCKYHIKYIHLRKKFPYGAAYPIVKYFYQSPGTDGAIDFVAGLVKEYGDDPVVCFYINTYLIPTTPKLLQFVLGSTKLLNKSDEYKFSRDWLGNGLLTSTGLIWKNHRKILTPSFHYQTLARYVKVFDSKSFILVDKLRPHVGEDEVEIFDKISLFTLDVIGETVMGIQLNSQDNSKDFYVQNVKKMGIYLLKRLMTPLRIDLIFRLSSYYTPYKQLLTELLGFSTSVVNQRKIALKNLKENSEVDQLGFKKNYTFLDVLLKSTHNGQYLTAEEVREEVDTFLFEGHETTAVAICFCFYLLSKHSDVQQRAYEEVVSILGKNKNVGTTYSNLQEMKYLEKVLKESLRLYPPVYVFSRELNQNILYDNTVLPEGLQVTIAPFLIHRNPAFYPNPERFDPDRFSQEEMKKRHPYVYLPFSAGPRNCIGQKFAMLELKCTVAKLLRYYRILPAIPENTVQLTCRMTLASKNDIKIRLEEREEISIKNGKTEIICCTNSLLVRTNK